MATDGISITVTPKKADFKKVDKILSKLSPRQNQTIWDHGLTRMALILQKIATTEEIKRGRGRFAAPLVRRLTHRTGTLVRSIAPDFSQLPRIASVGTDLNYGRLHEEGGTISKTMKKSGKTFTATYPKRPFLAPAGKKAKKKFAAVMIRVIEEQLT